MSIAVRGVAKQCAPCARIISLARCKLCGGGGCSRLAPEGLAVLTPVAAGHMPQLEHLSTLRSPASLAAAPCVCVGWS